MNLLTTIRKVLACFALVACSPFALDGRTASTSPWHGTLVLAMVSENEAVLAADSLVVRGSGAKRQTHNDCKIQLLGTDMAAAIGGVEKPLQEAFLDLASKGPQRTESLKQMTNDWYELAVSRLTGYRQSGSLRPREEEYQDVLGGAIFVRTRRNAPIEYVETRIRPLREGVDQFKLLPEREWMQFSNFKMNSGGGGEGSLEFWFTGRTTLGKQDRAFIRDLDINPLIGKQLDDAALRIMNGAIDADKQRAQDEANYQQIIDAPIELLHFDRRTGKMHWVQNTLCPAVPAK